MKSGFITILGRPNAGKSTLLNCLLNEKIAIATHKAQTTRNAILGIYNDEEYQLIFVDTPGIHEAKSYLGLYMNKEAMSQVEGADAILYMIDGKKGLQDEDIDTLKKVNTYKIPVILVVNKIDIINKDKLLSRLVFANNNYKFDDIVPISALNKENVNELLNVCKKYVKDEVKYYPDDTKTNVNINFQISEIIREKIILNTDKEVPHLVACKVDDIKENKTKVYIQASIICNKQSHKAIIIGKSGSMLKKINDQSCNDISKLYNKKIILSLFVKVEEDWLNSQKQLFNLGYFSGDKDE